MMHSDTKNDDLIRACCDGRIEVLEAFFEKGKATKLINKKSEDGLTLLHYAVRYNHYALVAYLLAKNADPNTPSAREKATPLHFATRYKITSCSTANRRTGASNTLEVQEKAHSTTVCRNIPPPTTTATATTTTTTTSGLKAELATQELSYDSRGEPIAPYSHKRHKLNESHLTCVRSCGDTIIKMLVSAGADVNARDWKGATPLHYASMQRNVSAVEEMLSLKIINVQAKDDSWLTALHYAAEQGCVPIASLLIAHSADIYSLNKSDMTPLHLAAEEGHPDAVELLIKHAKATDPTLLDSYVNRKDRHHKTALHYAAVSGNERLVRILIENHADPSIPTLYSHSTPLHLACATGCLAVVKLLVEYRSDLLEARDHNSETPLHLASSLNRIDIVEYLLQKGVDCNSRDKDHETPLLMASKKDCIEIVRLLLQFGADLMARDDDDRTALHLCALNNSLKCAEYFLSLAEASKLQNSWDTHENRPIHLAVQKNFPDMVSILVLFNAPNDSKNDSGFTPLLIAADCGYLHVLKILVDHSPSLAHDEDDFKNTALHLCAENGHFRLLPLLVNCGIPVDSRNINQFTPLDMAAYKGYAKAGLILIEAEAVVDPPETSKPSPLLIASERGHADMVSLLLSHGADALRTDGKGRNCLDIAIDENSRGVALAIINSSRWELTLRHISVYENKYCSPFRRLIRIMPDVAEVVLDKCLKSNGLPRSHPKYELHCNYEYLEDMHTAWGAKLKTDTYLSPYEEGLTSSSIFTHRIRSIMRSFKSNSTKSHPLSLIIEKKRVSLLLHPLVRYLMRNKWRRTVSHIYYSRMIFFCIYIIFLTSFCIITSSPPYPCIRIDDVTTDDTLRNTSNIPFSASAATIAGPLQYSYWDNTTGCISCPLVIEKMDAKNLFFVTFGKYVILFMAIFNIISRAFVIIMDINNIINPQNLLELLGSFLGILFISGTFHREGRPVEFFPFFRCTNLFRSIGALALCLTWLSFVLFLSKLPKIGIYVVMYTDIFRTFMQFMPVYFMLLISFAIPFYMLFLDRYTVNSYTTPIKALMKTFIGTIGEVEYDTFYNTSDEPPLDVTYVILFLYLLSNSIILMNLLVGLAVDDIQGVQANAFLKRLGLQIKMAMEVESMLPDNIRQKIVLMDEHVLPNEAIPGGFWSLWEFKTNPFDDKEPNSQEGLQEAQKELKEAVRQLKQQIKGLNDRSQKMEHMLEELLRRDTSICANDL